MGEWRTIEGKSSESESYFGELVLAIVVGVFIGVVVSIGGVM